MKKIYAAILVKSQSFICTLANTGARAVIYQASPAWEIIVEPDRVICSVPLYKLMYTIENK